jgi:hypothetical protein
MLQSRRFMLILLKAPASKFFSSTKYNSFQVANQSSDCRAARAKGEEDFIVLIYFKPVLICIDSFVPLGSCKTATMVLCEDKR